MSVPTDAHRALLALRVSVTPDAIDHDTQRLFEQWIKLPQWFARSEALALVVGIDPAQWITYLQAREAETHEFALWQILAASLGCDEDDDPPVSPTVIHAWTQRVGIALPLALARLFEFLSRVLPEYRDDQSNSAAQTQIQQSEDRVTVLGAALSLVSKTPALCIDEDGYFNSAKIAELVFRQAVFWFPLAPPQLTQAEAAELIGKWLAARGD